VYGGSRSAVFISLGNLLSNEKKIDPKSCGEVFELKKLVKLETKVGEIVSQVIKVGEKHERSPPYFELQK
jgi:hypothetical protein